MCFEEIDHRPYGLGGFNYRLFVALLDTWTYKLCYVVFNGLWMLLCVRLWILCQDLW